MPCRYRQLFQHEIPRRSLYYRCFLFPPKCEKLHAAFLPGNPRRTAPRGPSSGRNGREEVDRAARCVPGHHLILQYQMEGSQGVGCRDVTVTGSAELGAVNIRPQDVRSTGHRRRTGMDKQITIPK